jgi:bacterioferritin (cytochrome b1)
MFYFKKMQTEKVEAMSNNSEETIITLAILNSIDKEELLIKKYKTYENSTDSSEWKSLLQEFQKSSEEHIDLLKNKLEKFNA